MEPSSSGAPNVRKSKSRHRKRREESSGNKKSSAAVLPEKINIPTAGVDGRGEATSDPALQRKEVIEIENNLEVAQQHQTVPEDILDEMHGQVDRDVQLALQVLQSDNEETELDWEMSEARREQDMRLAEYEGEMSTQLKWEGAHRDIERVVEGVEVDNEYEELQHRMDEYYQGQMAEMEEHLRNETEAMREDFRLKEMEFEKELQVQKRKIQVLERHRHGHMRIDKHEMGELEAALNEKLEVAVKRMQLEIQKCEAAVEAKERAEKNALAKEESLRETTEEIQRLRDHEEKMNLELEQIRVFLKGNTNESLKGSMQSAEENGELVVVGTEIDSKENHSQLDEDARQAVQLGDDIQMGLSNEQEQMAAENLRELEDKTKEVDALMKTLQGKELEAESLRAELRDKGRESWSLLREMEVKESLMESLTKQLADRDAELENLQADMAVGERQVDILAKDLQEKEHENLNLQTQLMDKDEEIKVLKAEAIAMQEDAMLVVQRLREENQRPDNSDMLMELELVREELEGTRADLEVALESLSMKETQLRSLSGELQTAMNAISEKDEQLQNALQHLQNVQKEAEAVKGKNQRLSEEVEESSKDIQSIKALLEKTVDEKTAEIAMAEESKLKAIKSLEDERTVLMESNALLHNKYEDASQKINDLVKSMDDKVLEIRNMKSIAEESTRTHSEERNQLETKLQEQERVRAGLEASIARHVKEISDERSLRKKLEAASAKRMEEEERKHAKLAANHEKEVSVVGVLRARIAEQQKLMVAEEVSRSKVVKEVKDLQSRVQEVEASCMEHAMQKEDLKEEVLRLQAEAEYLARQKQEAMSIAEMERIRVQEALLHQQESFQIREAVESELVQMQEELRSLKDRQNDLVLENTLKQEELHQKESTLAHVETQLREARVLAEQAQAKAQQYEEKLLHEHRERESLAMQVYNLRSKLQNLHSSLELRAMENSSLREEIKTGQADKVCMQQTLAYQEKELEKLRQESMSEQQAAVAYLQQMKALEKVRKDLEAKQQAQLEEIKAKEEFTKQRVLEEKVALEEQVEALVRELAKFEVEVRQLQGALRVKEEEVAAVGLVAEKRMGALHGREQELAILSAELQKERKLQMEIAEILDEEGKTRQALSNEIEQLRKDLARVSEEGLNAKRVHEDTMEQMRLEAAAKEENILKQEADSADALAKLQTEYQQKVESLMELEVAMANILDKCDALEVEVPRLQGIVAKQQESLLARQQESAVEVSDLKKRERKLLMDLQEATSELSSQKELVSELENKSLLESHRKDELEKSLELAEAQLAESRLALEQKAVEIQEAVAEAAQLREQLREGEHLARKLVSEREGMRSDMAAEVAKQRRELKGMRVKEQTEALAVAAMVEKLQASLSSEKEARAVAEARAAEAEAEAAEERERVKQGEHERQRARQEVDAANQRAAAFEASQGQAVDRENAAQELLRGSQMRLEEKHAQVVSLEAVVDRVQQSLLAQEQEFEEARLRDEQGHKKVLAEVKEQLGLCRIALQDTEGKLQQQKWELRAREEEIRTMRQEAQDAEVMEGEIRQALESVQAELNEKAAQHQQLISDKKKLEGQLQKADVQSVVLQEEVALLQQNTRARGEEAENLVEELARQKQQHDSALQALRNETENVLAEGWAKEAAAREVQAKSVEKERSLKEQLERAMATQEEAAVLRESVRQLQEEIRVGKQATLAAELRAENLHFRLLHAEEEAVDVEGALKARTAEVEQYTVRAAEAAEAAKASEAKVIALEAKLHESEDWKARLVDDHDRLVGEMESYVEEGLALREVVEQREAQLAETTSKLDQLREVHSILKEEWRGQHAKLESQSRAAALQAAQRGQELGDTRARIKSLDEELKAMKATLEEERQLTAQKVQETVDSERAALAHAEKQLAALAEVIKQKDERLAGLISEREDAKVEQQEQVNLLQEEMRRAKEEAEMAQRDARAQESELEKTHMELQVAVERMVEDEVRQEEERAKMQSVMGSLQAHLGEATTALAEMTAEVEALREQILDQESSSAIDGLNAKAAEDEAQRVLEGAEAARAELLGVLQAAAEGQAVPPLADEANQELQPVLAALLTHVTLVDAAGKVAGEELERLRNELKGRDHGEGVAQQEARRVQSQLAEVEATNRDLRAQVERLKEEGLRGAEGRLQAQAALQTAEVERETVQRQLEAAQQRSAELQDSLAQAKSILGDMKLEGARLEARLATQQEELARAWQQRMEAQEAAAQREREALRQQAQEEWAAREAQWARKFEGERQLAEQEGAAQRRAAEAATGAQVEALGRQLAEARESWLQAEGQWRQEERRLQEHALEVEREAGTLRAKLAKLENAEAERGGKQRRTVTMEAGQLAQLESYITGMEERCLDFQKALENKSQEVAALAGEWEHHMEGKDSALDALLSEMERELHFRDDAGTESNIQAAAEEWRQHAVELASVHLRAKAAARVPSSTISTRTPTSNNHVAAGQQLALVASDDTGGNLMDLEAAASRGAGGPVRRAAGFMSSWLPSSHPYLLGWGGAPRRQQRWMVDSTWIDAMRKEHAEMKQSLEDARGRCSDLDQVRAEREWIEAALGRSMEQKRRYEAKVSQLHNQLAQLEALTGMSAEVSSV